MADLKPEMTSAAAQHTVKATPVADEMDVALEQHTLIVKAKSIEDTMTAPAQQHTMIATALDDGLDVDAPPAFTLGFSLGFKS